MGRIASFLLRNAGVWLRAVGFFNLCIWLGDDYVRIIPGQTRLFAYMGEAFIPWAT